MPTPSPSPSPSPSPEDAVRRAEAERCRAVSEQDWVALDALLADELTHTHMNGTVEDKPTLLASLRARPRRLRRGELQVRRYGDLAIMNGRQFLDRGSGTEVENEALQVWERTGEGWRLLAFQASPVA